MFRKRAFSGLLRLANPSADVSCYGNRRPTGLQSQAEGLPPREIACERIDGQHEAMCLLPHQQVAEGSSGETLSGHNKRRRSRRMIQVSNPLEVYYERLLRASS